MADAFDETLEVPNALWRRREHRADLQPAPPRRATRPSSTRPRRSIGRRRSRELGHDVRPGRSRSADRRLVGTLRRLAPELVFNLAEGERGAIPRSVLSGAVRAARARHTGSSASVLALCLDKALAKRVVAAAGVAVPAGTARPCAVTCSTPRRRLIVKPNFEGLEQGHHAGERGREPRRRSSVWSPRRSRAIPTVSSSSTSSTAEMSRSAGSTAACSRRCATYVPTGRSRDRRATLKRNDRTARRGCLAVDRASRRAATLAFAALGVAGYGRADFRVTPGGEVVFLEMNPLPSLAFEHNELYVRRSRRDVIAAIVAGRVTLLA